LVTQASTDRGESTRRRILEIAARHFLERGYSGVSLNEIIRDSGVTKGGLYFHFSSKADLALEALEMVRSGWREEVIAAAGYHPRAVDQIATMVRSAAAGKHNHPAGTAIGRLCQELALQPELAERLHPFDAWFAITADLFRLVQVQGEMDPTVDVDSAAQFAVCAYLGFDQFADVSGDPGLVERTVDSYLSYVFRAVGITSQVPPSP
jgi:AcrR family transcriptional regulator